MSRTRCLRTRFTAAVMAAIALAACNGPTGPEADLEAARRRWSDAEVAAYEMTLERQCFCGPELTTPVVVTVRGGQVESRRYAASGASVDARFAASFPSVDGLFVVIEDAFRRNAARVSAAYDPERGYPVRIDIDYETNMADDEQTYLVRQLRPL